MTVYADIVFFGNLISSLLLLFSVGIIFNIKGEWYRLLLASVLCGLYAVGEQIFLLWQPFRVGVVFLMTATAWGWRGAFYNTLRAVFVSTVVVVTVAGVCAIIGINSYIAISGITVVANSGVVAVICIFAYPVTVGLSKLKKKYDRLISGEFTIDGRALKFRLLYDSGNLLRHKGMPVVVMDWKAFGEILNVNSYDEAVLKAQERLIYNTVSASGIMPLIKPEKAVIRGIGCETYIGLTKRHFTGYQGVIGDID